jgi:uncharacterized membrane protein
MDRKYFLGIEDGGRTAGMVSYFFVIGWSVGYFGFHQPNKTSLSSFHLRQTLFLYITYLAIWFGIYLFSNTLGDNANHPLLLYMRVGSTAIFVLMWLIGLNGANNSEHKPIPVLGNIAQKVFSFI